MRNPHISVLKGIVIILMVMGHAKGGGFLNSWMSLFRMPFFFMLSGYLLKEAYLDDKATLVKRRFKNIYWPFFKWNALFIVFNSLLFSLNLSTQDYPISEIPIRIFNLVFRSGMHPLLVPCWFLRDLFISAVLCVFILWAIRNVLRSLNISPRQSELLFRIIIFKMVLVFLSVAWLVSRDSIHIPFLYSRSFLAFSFFLTGFLVRRFNPSVSIKTGVSLLAISLIIALYVFSSGISFAFGNGRGWENGYTYVIAIITVAALWGCAPLIQGFARKCLEYVGNRSIRILIFHIVAFRITYLLYFFILGVEYDNVGWMGYHTSLFLSTLYVLAGVGLPLLAWEVAERSGTWLRARVSGLRLFSLSGQAE